MNRISNDVMEQLRHVSYDILRKGMAIQDLFLDGQIFYIVEVRDGKKTEYWATPHLHPNYDKAYEDAGFELATLDVRVLYCVEPKSKTATVYKLFS